MTLSPTTPMLWAAQQIVYHMDYPSAVFSGINGDQRHFERNTYHIGIAELPIPDGFSNVRPDDKAPPGTWSRWHSSAEDISMSKADMVKNYYRWLVVFNNRRFDPRAKFFNAYNGWDGVGDAKRMDFVTGTIGYATPDHTWHRHNEKRRRYWNDWDAAKAQASVDRGESMSQYISGNGGSDKMYMYVRDTSNGEVWFTDGIHRRWVTADEYAVWSVQTAYPGHFASTTWQNGQIHDVGHDDINAFGVPVNMSPSMSEPPQ